MKITYLGHACFVLDDGTHKIIVDPYLTGNPLAAAKPEEIDCDMIFVTHGHDDHLGDAVAIARRTGATVFGLVDVMNSPAIPQDVKTAQGNTGGRQATPFGSVKIVNAIHGSGIPGALACGFVFEMGGLKLYHAGDTALTMDMQLLEDENIDVAMLPIGDFFTMGPADAVKAVKMIKPKTVIPMHFNTFPPIKQDGAAFCASVEAQTPAKAKLMAPGDTIEL